MDFMNFSTIPFGADFHIGLECRRLNELIGVGSWFDSFTLQNTMWLSLVKKILVAINSEQVTCAVTGLYPSYLPGILKHVEEINF